MEKEVMGREEDGGAERPLVLPLCCLHCTESKSLISNPVNSRGAARAPLRFWSRSDTKLHARSSEVKNVQTRRAVGVYRCLTRRFCRASGGEPFERRRSASRSHDAGRAAGASGARVASAGSSGALGLPDPPAPQSKIKRLGPTGSREERQRRKRSENNLNLCLLAAVGHHRRRGLSPSAAARD